MHRGVQPLIPDQGSEIDLCQPLRIPANFAAGLLAATQTPARRESSRRNAANVGFSARGRSPVMTTHAPQPGLLEFDIRCLDHLAPPLNLFPHVLRGLICRAAKDLRRQFPETVLYFRLAEGVIDIGID